MRRAKGCDSFVEEVDHEPAWSPAADRPPAAPGRHSRLAALLLFLPPSAARVVTVADEGGITADVARPKSGGIRRRLAARLVAAVVLLTAGLLAAAALGLTRTLPPTLGVALGLGLVIGGLLRSLRELLAVPVAVALGAAGLVTLAGPARVPGDDLPRAVAWFLTVGVLIVPALLGAAATVSALRRLRRRA